VNGHPVTDKEVVDAASAVQRIYTQGDPPTFFECATAMAFYHFAHAGVDVAVLETGMGGRFDATNLVHPEVAVITNVAVEHTEYLGRTLGRIAEEKAGIIKHGAGVVTGVKQPSALRVIQTQAEQNRVSLLRLGRDIRVRRYNDGRFSCRCAGYRWPRLEVGLFGRHQIDNAALALGVVGLLRKKGWGISDEAVDAGLKTVRWPGRLQVVRQHPLMILDGAHNPAAVRALCRFLKSERTWRRLSVVVGILKDKAWKSMLRDLADVCDTMILTRPRYERAADPRSFVSFVHNLNCPTTVADDVHTALSLAVKNVTVDDAVCVTGSLYTVGEAMACLDPETATLAADIGALPRIHL
ncbi:MAG: bifunctional folylpolyglutamate synthase/dihydrofolate synthase, partial [Deltaproteobacteria bacterium]|nr:bifunctional folylpolyglutamate synthase/dihydrofolate synthase [Deltaproteobacteria bacterium]